MLIEPSDIEQTIAELYRQKYEELLNKVHSYYHEELKLRGDKNMEGEYRAYFSIEA